MSSVGGWEGHGGFERRSKGRPLGREKAWVPYQGGGCARVERGKDGGLRISCGGGTHVVGKVMGGGSEKREDALGLIMILVRKRLRSSGE